MRGGPFQGWDTNLGGRDRDFPPTAWSRLLDAGQGGASERLRYLAERYWKPVYAYVRNRRRCGNEEAKDLTQEFFLWIMESGFLDKLDQGRGTFRGFLKTTLANFLTNDAIRLGRKKRGGGAKLLSIDAGEDKTLEPGDEREAPEEVLDRTWRQAVIEQALARVRTKYEGEGKPHWVALWNDYDLSPERAGLDHAALSERYRVSRREVSYALTCVRAAFRDAVVQAVSETVRDADECQRELRELFGQA